jgi:uncharacterized membrane protein YgaE (UPF0421/DUF939 family)
VRQAGRPSRAGVPHVIGITLRRLRLHGPRHWLAREREAFLQTAKAAFACVLAWIAAKNVFGSPEPILAPIGALIAIQVTVYQSITRAMQYSLGVLIGVAAALATGHFVGLTWYTLLAIVIVSLIVGRTLSLGTQVNQVAITGLLVLALGQNYGATRLYDSIIGTVIGIAVNMLIVPPTYTNAAAKELGDLADDLADLARGVAKRLRGQWGHPDSTGWLANSRRLTETARRVHEVVGRAEESVRFHPRRAAHADEVHRVRVAAVCLTHVANQLNSAMRGLNDMSSQSVRGIGTASAEVPADIPALLDVVARALGRFARLQLPDRSAPRSLEELRVLIREGYELGRRAAVAIQPDDTDPAMLWPVFGALLDSVQRAVYELDPDEGPHGDAIPSAVRDVLGPVDEAVVR